MAMNELTWTTDPPTQPGLYWYREARDDQPDVVLVADYGLGLRYTPHDDDSWYPLSPIGQWAGPLEPPK